MLACLHVRKVCVSPGFCVVCMCRCACVIESVCVSLTECLLKFVPVCVCPVHEYVFVCF